MNDTTCGSGTRPAIGGERDGDRSGQYDTRGGTGGPDTSKMHYNISAIQVGNAVRDGDEFVLMVRSKQSEGFTLWSSGDQEATEQLVKQATAELLQPA